MYKKTILDLLLKNSIEVWTSKEHPWNYVGNKIALCWMEYESNMNNNSVDWFWFWQFDQDNLNRLLHLCTNTPQEWINEEMEKIYQVCYKKWEYKFPLPPSNNEDD